MERLSDRQACPEDDAGSRLIVFAGPSLGAQSTVARNINFQPPARCGDITRVMAARPTAIGLIDGVFETAPSVWHKEIIYALSLGVMVFGAASIGALRAVELAPFGMIGIGEVFRAYRDGEIEDDDEVAVLHGPAELGYPTLTEAMVNVRATLDAATRARVLRGEERTTLARTAKSIFYKHRTWNAIVNRAASDGVPPANLRRFTEWRPTNSVDVKMQDAQLLIAALQNDVLRGSNAGTVPELSQTTFWIAHAERHNAISASRPVLSRPNRPP